MKSSRYTPEQVAFGLRQAEEGTPVSEVCRKMGTQTPPGPCLPHQRGSRRSGRRRALLPDSHGLPVDSIW